MGITMGELFILVLSCLSRVQSINSDTAFHQSHNSKIFSIASLGFRRASFSFQTSSFHDVFPNVQLSRRISKSPVVTTYFQTSSCYDVFKFSHLLTAKQSPNTVSNRSVLGQLELAVVVPGPLEKESDAVL